MEALAYLDTHVLILLYGGEHNNLSKQAIDIIESSKLFVSPASILELEYLHEIKRLKPQSKIVISYLMNNIGLLICDLSFQVYANEALEIKWTRDPFDRLITAGAMARKCHLVTKDENILKHYQRAIW